MHFLGREIEWGENAAKKDGLEGRKARSPKTSSMVEPVKRKNEEKTEDHSTKHQKWTHNEEKYKVISPVMKDGSNGKKAKSPSASSMMAPVDRKDEEKATPDQERTLEKLVIPIFSSEGPSSFTEKQEETQRPKINPALLKATSAKLDVKRLTRIGQKYFSDLEIQAPPGCKGVPMILEKTLTISMWGRCFYRPGVVTPD